MGQFKPMVKMFTDEPSVILKLKKGGKVQAPGQAEGFKSMTENSSKNVFDGAESGKAPKKPSMAERRKAMNPNQYAKGGNVAKMDGGPMLPRGLPVTNPVSPLARNAIAAMPDADRMARAAMVRKALTGMKKGGDTSKIEKLEKELKHHEAMSASKAHLVKKASGGKIDKFETKTTIEGNAGKFAKTKVVGGDKKDKAHGTKGIKEGQPAGFAMGGTIEGNEGKFAKTKVVGGDKTDKAHGTKGVKEGKVGGFAIGGSTAAKFVNDNVDDGDKFDPAHGTTGVREANAGGYKKGGSTKKAYATGGNVVDDGKASKMPSKPVSRPVANSLQSGTFKKGGKVRKFEDGGPTISSSKTNKGYANASKNADELEDALNPLSMLKEGYNKVKNYFIGDKSPAGSVTKTEKSVTVAPKKRGGTC